MGTRINVCTDTRHLVIAADHLRRVANWAEAHLEDPWFANLCWRKRDEALRRLRPAGRVRFDRTNPRSVW